MNLSLILTYSIYALAVFGLISIGTIAFMVFNITHPNKPNFYRSTRAVRIFGSILVFDATIVINEHTKKKTIIQTPDLYPLLYPLIVSPLSGYNSSWEQRINTHHAWVQMILGCTDASHRDFPSLGAKGITVVPEWMIDFECFVDEIGYKPSPNSKLMRHDESRPFNIVNTFWLTLSK